MPWFDIIVLSILLASAGIGFWQGAVREMVAMISFLLAIAAAVYGAKYGVPLGRLIFPHPDWAGWVAAVVGVFVLTYAGLRFAGAGITKAVQQTPVLGTVDRTVGLGFGLVRALVFLGALNLAFVAATPTGLMPAWLTGSATYPLTAKAGHLLRAIAPKGLDMAGRFRPAIDGAVRDISARPTDDLQADQGYDARRRTQIDALVEKSR